VVWFGAVRILTAESAVSAGVASSRMGDHPGFFFNSLSPEMSKYSFAPSRYVCLRYHPVNCQTQCVRKSARISQIFVVINWSVHNVTMTMFINCIWCWNWSIRANRLYSDSRSQCQWFWLFCGIICIDRDIGTMSCCVHIIIVLKNNPYGKNERSPRVLAKLSWATGGPPTDTISRARGRCTWFFFNFALMKKIKLWENKAISNPSWMSPVDHVVSVNAFWQCWSKASRAYIL